MGFDAGMERPDPQRLRGKPAGMPAATIHQTGCTTQSKWRAGMVRNRPSSPPIDDFPVVLLNFTAR
jgi:hypothetical protein